MNGYVELITGGLGSGKTLFAVQRIFEHLAAGGYVFTNIAIYPEKMGAAIRERKGRIWDAARLKILTDAEAAAFNRHVARGTAECQVMVAIDEAGLDFDARDWKNTDTAIIAFSALARKMDVCLLYVTQQAADLDKRARGKCRCEWQCRNLHNLRLFGVLPFSLPLWARVCFDTSKGKHRKINDDTFLAPTWVFSLYDSNSLIGKGAAAVAGLKQVSGLPLARVEAAPVLSSRYLVPAAGLFSLCGALSYFS